MEREWVDLQDFVKEVDLARRNGYATDRGEHTEGSSCLATPIYDYTRKVVAALSISGHGLLDNFSESEVYEIMQEAATQLSTRMGYTKSKDWYGDVIWILPFR